MGMLPKPTYTGGVPGVQERHQLGRERAFIRQDPRAGLDDVEVRRRPGAQGRVRRPPGAQGRVRRQPRPVGEDVVADVVHRWQADRRPVGVNRRAEQRIHALGVQIPQHPVVGHVRWERPSRPRVRRVVRRRQGGRLVARVHVADAQFLGHRPRAGRGREQAGRHQRITPLGCRSDRAELCADQLGRTPGQVRHRRRRRRSHHRLHRQAGRHQRHAGTGQPLRELLVRRRAHPHLRAELPQPHRESRHRFDVAARPVRQQQHAHFAALISVGSGLDQRLCGTTRVLPQAPRCAID